MFPPNTINTKPIPLYGHIKPIARTEDQLHKAEALYPLTKEELPLELVDYRPQVREARARGAA